MNLLSRILRYFRGPVPTPRPEPTPPAPAPTPTPPVVSKPQPKSRSKPNFDWRTTNVYPNHLRAPRTVGGKTEVRDLTDAEIDAAYFEEHGCHCFPQDAVQLSWQTNEPTDPRYVERQHQFAASMREAERSHPTMLYGVSNQPRLFTTPEIENNKLRQLQKQIANSQARLGTRGQQLHPFRKEGSKCK